MPLNLGSIPTIERMSSPWGCLEIQNITHLSLSIFLLRQHARPTGAQLKEYVQHTQAPLRRQHRTFKWSHGSNCKALTVWSSVEWPLQVATRFTTKSLTHQHTTVELWSIFFLNKTAILRGKKSYLSRIFRPPFAEPFCHPIFRKNMVYLSRKFRPPFAEPFCRLSRKKKKVTFAKLSRTTFEALQWSSFTKSFTRGFWSILS